MALSNNERTFFIDRVEELSICGSKMYQFVGSEFRKPTDFTRLSYEKHNLNNCETCRKQHEELIERMQREFKRFPNCCKLHENLEKANWFNRKDFEDIPRLYADKLYYTWHHICQFIEEPNWKIEIIDFIEHIFNTFGDFPAGYGEALFFRRFTDQLLDIIETKVKEPEKKSAICQFVIEYIDPPTENKADFNILLGAYNKWYNTFPFELPFLSHLKPHFENTIPIIETTHFNKYLGYSNAKLKTKENLIDLLVSMTDSIVTTINTATLYKEGKITDLDQAELDLQIQKRLQKLKKGYQDLPKDPDTRYRKIVKKWLKDELEFIQVLKDRYKRNHDKQQKIHNALLNACAKMQENRLYWKVDENARTRQILDLLSPFLFTKDQSQYGVSETGKKPGSIDGVLIDADNREYFIEAFNLNGMDRNVIQRHINKVEKNYDSKGLTLKYLLVYCNVEDHKFGQLFNDYYKYITEGLAFHYSLINHTEKPCFYTNTRQIETTHQREGKVGALYHILIKMPSIDASNLNESCQ